MADFFVWVFGWLLTFVIVGGVGYVLGRHDALRPWINGFREWTRQTFKL